MLTLSRIGDPGQERAFARDGDRWYSLTPLGVDVGAELFERGGFDYLRRVIDRGELEPGDVPPHGRIGSPLARPAAVICIGMNYAAHARETGAEPPEHPVIFFKHPNTVVGPHDDVLLPRDAERLDWEAELGIVVGRRAHLLPDPTAAQAHIGGFVLSHDVSERAHQFEVSGGQWSKGKSSPTFNPLGPEIVEPSALDLNEARIWSRVNGEIRQDSVLGDMIFPPDVIVWHVSQYMALEPGDLINTGTPEGVAMSGRFPYLVDGDLVEVGIDGLGTQRQVIRAAPTVPARL